MSETTTQVRAALEAAREALTRHQGLLATDRPDAYQRALVEGYDAEGAHGAQRDASWILDESAALAAIDAARGEG